ncbi:MAG: hypothetical protein KGH58_04720 [Candidatus Micrarchaeota archaeon]|nr:hypothetical protein [Candidatus Micrarchaeota archaeon]
MAKDMLTKMEYVRSFIKKPSTPKVDDNVWELLGVCLGDGCLSEYTNNYDNQVRHTVLFTGNARDDYGYYFDHLVPLINSKFNIAVHPRIRFDCNTINIFISNKIIFDFFNGLGMPTGHKKGKLEITPKLSHSKKSAKAAILRGLFDTDGHIFARKDEGYRYPHIKITSATPYFLVQLKDLIREFGLPAYIHDIDVQLRGSKNIKKWMELIGTSHPTHQARYASWLETGKLLPKYIS